MLQTTLQHMKSTALVSGLLIFIGLFSLSCQNTPPPDTGPSFTILEDYEDLKPIFTKNNASTYVINFWATRCKPCVKELPYFEQLNQELKDEKVEVILVSLDFETDIETKLKPFIEEHQLQSDVIAFINGDYNSWIGEVEEAWDGAIPVTIVYSAKDRKFFSYAELVPHRQTIGDQASRANPEAQLRSVFERQIIKLANAMNQYERLTWSLHPGGNVAQLPMLYERWEQVVGPGREADLMAAGAYLGESPTTEQP